jgi:hypothetical protein
MLGMMQGMAQFIRQDGELVWCLCPAGGLQLVLVGCGAARQQRAAPLVWWG